MLRKLKVPKCYKKHVKMYPPDGGKDYDFHRKKFDSHETDAQFSIDTDRSQPNLELDSDPRTSMDALDWEKPRGMYGK